MSVEKSIKNQLAEGLRATLVSRTVYILANAALMLALTRYLLTPEGFGQLSFALAVLGSLHLLFGLGFSKSGARYVTQYLEADAAQVPHIIRGTTSILIGLILIVSLSLWSFRGELALLLNEADLVPFLTVGVGYVVLYPFAISIRLLFNAFNKITWSAILRTIDALVRLIFAIVFVLLGFGAVGALMGYLVGFAVAAGIGIGVFFVTIYSTLEDADSPETGLRCKLVRYGVPLSFTQGADVLDKRIDAILVGVLLNPVAVGYYTLAKQISDFTIVPAQSIDTTIAPRLGERKASGELTSAARIYETSVKYVLLLYVPAGVGLALVAEPSIRFIFGEGYREAAPVLQIFAAFVIINALNTITTNSLDYLGRGRDRAIINAITAVSNVALNILLIPTIGVAGAAVATVITHSVYTAGNIYFLQNEVPLNVGRLFHQVGWILTIALAMGAVVWIFLPIVSGLASLIAVISVGVGVWAVLSIASGILELRIVREILI